MDRSGGVIHNVKRAEYKKSIKNITFGLNDLQIGTNKFDNNNQVKGLKKSSNNIAKSSPSSLFI